MPVDYQWLTQLLDHGVCVVVLAVIYFWRLEPLLSKLIEQGARAEIRLASIDLNGTTRK